MDYVTYSFGGSIVTRILKSKESKKKCSDGTCWIFWIDLPSEVTSLHVQFFLVSAGHDIVVYTRTAAKFRRFSKVPSVEKIIQKLNADSKS